MSVDLDAHQFNLYASHVNTVATHFIEAEYGVRCPEYDVDCVVCRKWAALDELLKSPYDDAEGKCVYDTNGDGDCHRCVNKGGCLAIGGPLTN